MQNLKLNFLNNLTTRTNLFFLCIVPLVFVFFSCSEKEAEERSRQDDFESVESVEHISQASSSLIISPGLEIDLGNIAEHQTIPLEFELTNSVDADLNIVDVSFNCPCGKFLTVPDNHLLKPNDSYILKLDLYAPKLPIGNFTRYININLGDDNFESITVKGNVESNFEVESGRNINLGILNDPSDEWQQKITVKGINFLAEKMKFVSKIESEYFNVNILELTPSTAELTLSSNGKLPYTNRFRAKLQLPVLEPAGSSDLVFNISGSVGTAINFKPNLIAFDKNDFAEAKTAAKQTSFGVIPQENNAEPEENEYAQRSKVLRGFFVKDTNAKLPINWFKLHEFLEFNCPAGVRVDKVLFDEGLLLNIVVDKTAFAENKRLEIIPYRDDNRYKKIRLFYRD